MIEITKCSIPQAWYMDHIGKRFKLEYEDRDGYWVREPSGYRNIVKKQDALYLEQK